MKLMFAISTIAVPIWMNGYFRATAAGTFQRSLDLIPGPTLARVRENERTRTKKIPDHL
jgi:hypothetical protein